MPTTQQIVVPRRQSGVVVDLAPPRSQPALVILQFDDGSAVPVGSEVTLSSGGVPMLVDAGQGGLLTAVGAISDMAACLLELARDRARRLAMGHFNRQRFLEFSHPDVVGRAALDLYRRLVERRTADG